MLQNLHVKNLALIEEADVNFENGLNILTGETGSGKSILIGSINVALGGKVNSDFTTEEFVVIILKNISDIEGTGRIHMYLLCEAIIGNEALRERIGVKYIEWRSAVENQIASIIDNKSDARAASFLLMSIVDGLVVQGILKAEKIPYSEIARFLIDYSNKIKTTSK